MTNKIHHDDCNVLITSHFFHFDAMISSLAKVMSLQSRLKQGPKCIYSKNIILDMEKLINMTAVMILVRTLIDFNCGSL